MKRCTKCGNLLDEEAKFCGNCGNIIKSYDECLDNTYDNNMGRDIDSFIDKEFTRKKSKSRLWFNLAAFIMLVAVIGVIIIFRVSFTQEYKEPLNNFFEAANNNDINAMCDTLFPGLPEYLGVSETTGLTEDACDDMVGKGTYTIQNSDHLNGSELAKLNDALDKCVGLEAEDAYRLTLEIDTTYYDNTGIVETVKDETETVVGYYEGEWYIISMAGIIDLE